MAGKDGKKHKNKKRDVNSRTKAGHGTDMDVFIDEVSTLHVTKSHQQLVLISQMHGAIAVVSDAALSAQKQ